MGCSSVGNPLENVEFCIETVKHSSMAYAEGANHTSKTTVNSKLAEYLCRLTYIALLP